MAVAARWLLLVLRERVLDALVLSSLGLLHQRLDALLDVLLDARLVGVPVDPTQLGQISHELILAERGAIASCPP